MFFNLDNLKIVQSKSNPNIKFRGYSKSSHRTGIEVIGLNILLDAGLDIQKSYQNIFISHQHLDHIIYIPQYILNTPKDQKEKVMIYVPPKGLKSIRNYITSALSVSFDHDKPTEIIQNIFNYNVVPVSNDKMIIIKNGSEKYLVKIFNLNHTVESIAYGFYSEKNKIKDEYKDYNSKQIVELKQQNIQITNIVISPLFVFIGDTYHNIFTKDEFLTFPTIIVECTYLLEDEEILSKQNKHICWSQLKPIILKNVHTQFILIHFSLKYTDDFIKNFFDLENLPNVELLL